MRVLVISNLYPPIVQGGAEISTEMLVESLRQVGHTVGVVTLQTDGAAVPKENDRQTARVMAPHPYFAFTAREKGFIAKVRWHSTELRTRGPAKEVAGIIDDLQPEAVLSQNLTGFGLRFLPAISRGLSHAPVIHTLRDYGLLCVKGTNYHGGESDCRRHPACSAKLMLSRRYIPSSVQGVVGISQVILDKHRAARLFESTPERVIHNAVELGRPSAAAPSELGAFGYLGRLSDEKGIEDLIDAYRAARLSNDELGDLVIAGTGRASYEQVLRRKAVGLPVRFLGRVSPGSLFSEVSTLVVPSRWDEPFGRVVIEAAAAGLRLVLSDRGGLVEAARSLSVHTPRVMESVTTFRGGDVASLALALGRSRELAPFPSIIDPPTGVDVASAYTEFIEELRR